MQHLCLEGGGEGGREEEEAMMRNVMLQPSLPCHVGRKTAVVARHEGERGERGRGEEGREGGRESTYRVLASISCLMEQMSDLLKATMQSPACT